MTKVFTPNEKVSLRHLEQTKEERENQIKAFRERKAEQEKIKDERFAAIQERRQKGPFSGGSGGGINIEITSDNDK